MLCERTRQDRIEALVFSVGLLLLVATFEVYDYSGQIVLYFVVLSPGSLIDFGVLVLQIPWLLLWMTSVGDPRRTLRAVMLLLIHQVSAGVCVIKMWHRGQSLFPQEEAGWLPQTAFYANAIAIVIFELWLWYLIFLSARDVRRSA